MNKKIKLTKFLHSLLRSYESIELSAKPNSYFYTVDVEQAFERLKKSDVKVLLPGVKDLNDRTLSEVADLLFIPGSSLPNLKIDEVEIARIEVTTILGLAYSLRAEWDDMIKYRLVSEMSTIEFEVPIKESLEPLTLREVILQFENARPAVGLSDLIHALEDDESHVISAHSAFYSGFRQFYVDASTQLMAR